MSILKSIWNKFHTNVFIDACKMGDEAQVLSMLGEEPELAEIKDKHGVSALFHAVANGHNKIAEAILRISNQPNDIEPEKGFTPLLIAATNGHIALVRILLQSGADPNIQNIDGITPLHNAVFEEQVDIAKLLLEAGADPLIPDRIGNTAIDLASQSESPEFRNLF